MKQDILDRLQEQLIIEQEREALYEREMDENPTDMNRVHYHSASGVVNGLLMAMDIVKGVK